MPAASSQMIHSRSMHARSATPVFVLGFSLGDTESAQSIPCPIGPFRSSFVPLVRQEVVKYLARFRRRRPRVPEPPNGAPRNARDRREVDLPRSGEKQ